MKCMSIVTLAALVALCCLDARAAWIPIEKFEGFAADSEIDGGFGWNALNSGSTTTTRRAIDDPTTPGANQVLQVKNDGSGDQTDIFKALPSAVTNTNNAASLFWRAYIPSDRTDGSLGNNGPDWTVALTQTTPPLNASSGSPLATYIGTTRDVGPNVIVDSINSAPQEIESYNGGDGLDGIGGSNTPEGGGALTTYSETISKGAWHNFWMVMDNVTDTYDLYISGGSIGGITQIADDAAFRIPQGDLLHLFIRVNSGQGTTEHFYIDDFYMDLSDSNLTSPVPEPTAACLVALCLMGCGVARRRA